MDDIVERLRNSGPIPSIFAVREAADEIERLRQRAEAAEKDADRYRWLRVQPRVSWGIMRKTEPSLPNEVDSTIDAAMKDQK